MRGDPAPRAPHTRPHQPPLLPPLRSRWSGPLLTEDEDGVLWEDIPRAGQTQHPDKTLSPSRGKW